MTNMDSFITSVEQIVSTELQTLKDFILENIGAKVKTIELAKYYDYVFKWAESVWVQRKQDEQ